VPAGTQESTQESCCVEACLIDCYLRNSDIYVHESCCLGVQRHLPTYMKRRKCQDSPETYMQQIWYLISVTKAPEPLARRQVRRAPRRVLASHAACASLNRDIRKAVITASRKKCSTQSQVITLHRIIPKMLINRGGWKGFAPHACGGVGPAVPIGRGKCSNFHRPLAGRAPTRSGHSLVMTTEGWL
jgi:hypothetical protein